MAFQYYNSSISVFYSPIVLYGY